VHRAYIEAGAADGEYANVPESAVSKPGRRQYVGRRDRAARETWHRQQRRADTSLGARGGAGRPSRSVAARELAVLKAELSSSAVEVSYAIELLLVQLFPPLLALDGCLRISIESLRSRRVVVLQP
jgi:hypothetical protein